MPNLINEKIIKIRKSNRNYALLFVKEKRNIENAIKKTGTAKIEHVGSTSIPGLGGQNVVDILVTINSFADVKKFMHALTKIGYLPREITEEAILKKRIHISKESNNVKYHLHLEEANSESAQKKIYFRDYLLRHPIEAKKYFVHKMNWAKQAGNDWAKYSSLKSKFIQRAIQKYKILLEKMSMRTKMTKQHS